MVERLEAEKTLESSLPSENAIDKKDREISGTDEKGIETLGKRGDEERGLEQEKKIRGLLTDTSASFDY